MARFSRGELRWCLSLRLFLAGEKRDGHRIRGQPFAVILVRQLALATNVALGHSGHFRLMSHVPFAFKRGHNLR